MEIKNLLPIGSVVLLKGGQKKLMICGIKQVDSDDNQKEYDYLGIFYPEGHIGSKFQYLFDHEKIEKIFFRGYEDEERSEFLSNLETVYKNRIKTN